MCIISEKEREREREREKERERERGGLTLAKADDVRMNVHHK